LCGHGFVATDPDVDDDDGAICDEPGCPCEAHAPVKVEPPPELAPVRKIGRGPDSGTVKMLEDLLAEAQAGKILGGVFVTNDAEGYYRTWQVGFYKAADVLYSFDVWKLRTIRRAEDD
jgi:hypothetical protein